MDTTTDNVEQVAAALAALADRSDWYCIGLRVDDVAYATGDGVPASRHWVDGEPTDEVLAGTCAINLVACDAESIADALERLEGYPGAHVVVVGGNRMERGEDDGEIQVVDAVCLACVPRSGK
jgi:hypothetical protein